MADSPQHDPFEMRVEYGEYHDHVQYVDYLINDGVEEGFLATLCGTELQIGWNGKKGTLLSRIIRVQKLAGREAFDVIKGYASDDLEEMILNGRFSETRWALALGKFLGGTWVVEVEKRKQRYDVTFRKIGE